VEDTRGLLNMMQILLHMVFAKATAKQLNKSWIEEITNYI
jgi:hypothetical protein